MNTLTCLILLLASAGCATRAGIPATCSEDPNYYHVYEQRSSKVTSPGPAYVRHVRKDEWNRGHGVVQTQPTNRSES